MNNAAFLILNRYKHNLTMQQYKTIKGQIKAGDAAGALKGLQRINNSRKRGNNSAGIHTHTKQTKSRERGGISP